MSVWVYANEKPQSINLYYFKKSFNAKIGDKFIVKMSADTRYQFYLNDSLVCEGPCQGAAHQRLFEVVDASEYLADGENSICVKVMYVGTEQFSIVYRSSRPALWFDGELQSGDETIRIGSDASWECLRDDGLKFIYHLGIHGSMPPCEEWLSEKTLTPVKLCNWFEPFLSTNGFSPYGTLQPYSLYERSIPQMKEYARRKMTAVKTGDGCVIYDSGEYTTAKVYLKINAPKDTTVRVTYAECCSFSDPVGAQAKGKAIRDDILAEGARIDGVFDLIHAKGGEEIFAPFWFRAFRYIKIEFPTDADCEIDIPEYAPYFYPFDEAGSFECSDEKYNKMWHVGRNTLLCCTHETYVDCPYYEQGQYSQDGGLEMLYTFRTSSDKLMPKKFVDDLAASLTHDGMICAHYPSTSDQVIPNFSFYWILALKDYLLYTGDKDTVKMHMGTADKVLEAFEILRNEDGLIGPTKYWAYTDWVPSWPMGVPPKGGVEPLTVTCLMYAAALRATSSICRTLGKNARSEEYSARAEEMIALVKKYCYDEEVGLFRDTVSGKTYSQHTTVWAVLSGAVTGEEAESLMDRTFNSNVKVEVCTFSMNYYLFRALEETNRYGRYAATVFAGWEKMLDLHCTTWCENPDNPRSECHAWSSAPNYEMSAVVLGVLPTSDGYASLRIKPDAKTLGLTFAKGSVPTPFGTVAVDWRIEGDDFTLNVSLPSADIKAEIVLPDGCVIVSSEANATYTCKL